MTLVHARPLLSIEEILFSLSSSSWNLKLSNLYAGKRGRLDLDLLNSPIWQVNRNRVKSVIAGPQQSLPPTRDWPHPGFYVRYAFRKVVRVLYVPFQLLRKDEGDKTNGLTSPLNDAIIITASIIYYPPHNTHTHTLPPRFCYTGARSTELTGRRLKYVLHQNSASVDSFESGGRVLLEVEYSIHLSLLPSNSSLMKNELRSGLGMYTPNLESARESKYLALKKNKREKIKAVFIKWD